MKRFYEPNKPPTAFTIEYTVSGYFDNFNNHDASICEDGYVKTTDGWFYFEVEDGELTFMRVHHPEFETENVYEFEDIILKDSLKEKLCS